MSGISGVGGNNPWLQAQLGARPLYTQKTKLAGDAFSKIDANGQGYFDIAALTTAVTKNPPAGKNNTKLSFSSSEIQTAFLTMDSDGDGKVTRQEFTSFTSQLPSPNGDQQADLSLGDNGISRQGISGMPPPPLGGDPKGGPTPGGPPPGGPPPGGPQGSKGPDVAFTADELKVQLKKIGESDLKTSNLINNVLDNFSAADTNGDGKVSFAEAAEFDKKISSSSSMSSSSSKSATVAISAGDQSTDTTTQLASATEQIQKLLLYKIMKVMEAYGAESWAKPGGSTGSQLAITA